MERHPDLNVVGGELLPCSTEPLTGFFRTGCCSTGPDDFGSHTVCCVMTDDFLANLTDRSAYGEATRVVESRRVELDSEHPIQ